MTLGPIKRRRVASIFFKIIWFGPRRSHFTINIIKYTLNQITHHTDPIFVLPGSTKWVRSLIIGIVSSFIICPRKPIIGVGSRTSTMTTSPAFSIIVVLSGMEIAVWQLIWLRSIDMSIVIRTFMTTSPVLSIIVVLSGMWIAVWQLMWLRSINMSIVIARLTLSIGRMIFWVRIVPSWILSIHALRYFHSRAR